MAIKINRITNANIYVDGNNLMGRAEEVDAPNVNFSQSEHKALGLLGKLEYVNGMEKMEVRIKWNAIYEDVVSKFANPWKVLRLQIRASLEKYEGGDRVSQLPVVIYCTCNTKGIPLGNFKQSDNIEVTTNLTCTHVKLEIAGKEKLEFDAEANIYRVDGVDQLAQYRANVGG